MKHSTIFGIIFLVATVFVSCAKSTFDPSSMITAPTNTTNTTVTTNTTTGVVTTNTDNGSGGGGGGGSTNIYSNPNILSNADFEDAVFTSGSYTNRWIVKPAQVFSNVYQAGTRSMVMNSGLNNAIQQVVVVSTNTSYKLSGYLNNKILQGSGVGTAGDGIMIGFYPAPFTGLLIGSVQYFPTNTGGWTNFNLTFNSGTNKSVALFVQVANTTGDSLVDNFSIVTN